VLGSRLGLRIAVVVGERTPAAFEEFGLLGDLVRSDGLVVLGGDPAGCAVLRYGVGGGLFRAQAVFGPDGVGAELNAW
jgi:hypothetical protein